jgi:hypothetical protein
VKLPRDFFPRILQQLIAVMMVAGLPAVMLAAPPDIARLDWQPRSDWINVKADVTPAAAGDGRADDTAALQAALDRKAVGKTVYLPPGTYRITQTLVFHGQAPGSAVIGHGRDTRLVWDGAEGGRMFWSDDIAYSRYIGLSWDGRGKAAIGFDHAAEKQFETELQHQDEAFRNFTGYGLRVGNEQQLASAEILFRNCLFENCGTALGFLTFNDYDNTIDRCEFRNCGTGVLAHKSNFYARNCHFENSRNADFVIAAEHGCSIRRCTSVGAKCFVRDSSTVVPLTIQDCHVASWTDPVAAVYLNGPTLMFDCTFSGVSFDRPPPVKLTSDSQKLLVSDNRPAPVEQLVQAASAHQTRVIPPGRIQGVIASAKERFLQETAVVPNKVLDAVRDFGAKGNEQADDTAAIQSAIDAARRFGRGAIAYLPSGRYRVSRTLLVTGNDYTLGGSGFRCGLIWRGKAGEPFITVSNVQEVTLANLAVGNGDFGEMNHGDDILVTSPSNLPCRLVLDGVYAYGKYQKAPDTHGIHFVGLPAGSVIDASGVQGNLRITDCTGAMMLFQTSYEGTVTIEGGEPKHNGLIGFLTRLTTQSRPALRVLDNQSAVMSDFYVEQSDQIAVFSGMAGQDPGAVTIQGPKSEMPTNGLVFDIHDYAGRIYYGQTQFYVTPAETKFRSQGTRRLELMLAGDFWYKNHPLFDLDQAARLTLLGNSGVTDSAVTPESLNALSAALDDLRRLGEMDHSARANKL